METTYIVAEMADDWYDNEQCIAKFNDYFDTQTFINTHNLPKWMEKQYLLDKLQWLEQNKEKFVYDGKCELVVSRW